MLEENPEIDTKVCPHCSREIAQGGGRGNNLHFSYEYCFNCDKFVVWEGFGMAPENEDDIKKWVRYTLLDNDKNKSPQE